MTADQYVRSVLAKYAVNRTAATDAGNAIAPTIRAWAGAYLADLVFSGSYAKGTANSIGTDIDLFISIRSSVPESLQQIYASLFNCAMQHGWNPIQQNVSIGVSYLGLKIDLVPGRIQSGFQNYHSLYKSKTGSWAQTNVKLHINTVADSYRAEEIRAIKIWRDLHRLSFPSFYLELFVIDALSGKEKGNVASNVLSALSTIGNDLGTKRIIDPANSNNVISDELTASEKNAVARHANASAAKPYWKDIIW